MRDVAVVEAEWPLADGEQLFLVHEELPDGTPLVEPAEAHHTQANGLWVDIRTLSGSSLQGVDNRKSSDSAHHRVVAGVAARVLREARPDETDEDTRVATCFEQVGTVVSVSVLVEEHDPDAAMEAVTAALAPVARDMNGPWTGVAVDRFHHVLESDGRVIAVDQPHWKIRGNYLVASALRPVHEALYEVVSSRALNGEHLRRASAERAVETRRARGTQRGGRRPSLTPGQQARVFDQDQTNTVTRKELAERWEISVPTLTRYLRAEAAVRGAKVPVRRPLAPSSE